MATRIRRQQPSKLQRFKQLPLGRLIIALLVSFFVVVGITIGVWNVSNSKNLIATVLSIAFACLCLVFVLLQAFVPLPVSPTRGRPSSSRELATSNKIASRRKLGMPPTNSRITQQHQKAVEDLYMKLTEQNVSAFALDGMVGVGKSTLAASLYDYAETQRLQGKGPFAAEAFWVKINNYDTLIDVAKALFKALRKPLPNFMNSTPNELAIALSDTLNTPKVSRLVVLDQFDNLLDVQTGEISASQADINEWIEILNKRRSSCRILFVTRFWPKNYLEHNIHKYHINGLEIGEGAELLRKLEVKGTEEEWHAAVEYCKGHPYALRILPTFLHDCRLSLSTFVKEPVFTKLWLKDVGHNLLDSIFIQQLGEVQRKLLKAFSIYREPMPLSAVIFLLNSDAELAQADIRHHLDILVAQYLIQKVGESRYKLGESAYQLHPIVASYAYDHSVESDEQTIQQTLRMVHGKAAQYYQEYTSIPGQRRDTNDVHPLIEAFWHRCQAGEYDKAYDLMEHEHIFSDLEEWGEITVLLELYQLLLPLDKWHPAPLQEVAIHNSIGKVYSELGQKQEAMKYFGRSLHVGDRWAEVRTFNYLGQIHDELGQYEEALKYYEQALSILNEIGDRLEERRTLHNMARVSKLLGWKTEAHKYTNQELSIIREIEHHSGEVRAMSSSGRHHDDHQQKKEHLERVLHLSQREGNREREVLTLRNLGRTYYDMGQKKKARELYVDALHIHKEEGNRKGVGELLQDIGLLYFEQHHYEAALVSLLLSQRILEEVQNPHREKAQRWIDTLHRKVGKQRFEELLGQVESQGRLEKSFETDTEFQVVLKAVQAA